MNWLYKQSWSSLLCSFFSRPLLLPPSSVGMVKFWSIYSFKHQHRYVWRNVEKMCYKAIENLWNVLDFSRRNKIFYRIISIREYICPLMFVQVWSSVLKNILNPTEIDNNNSFSVSVTIGVEFELHQHVKKYSHFGKNFCGYSVKKQYWWQWSRPPWCWWKRYCV